MAHMRELDQKCGNSWCGRRALVEVFDYQNTSYGTFCRKCGRERTRRLNTEEESRG